MIAVAGAATGIRRVAVIGAGVLGRRLAELCCNAGYSVVLEDVLPSRLRGAARAFQALSTDAGRGAVEYAGSIEEAVRDADLVIDCVPDELESKLEILSLIDRMAPPRTIIATPTWSLSIADLGSCTYRPERCLGLRLPAGILQVEAKAHMPAEELSVVTTAGTDSAVATLVVQFWQTLGFEAQLSLDPSPG